MKYLVIFLLSLCSASAYAAAANWTIKGMNVKNGIGDVSLGYSGTAYIYDGQIFSQSSLFSSLLQPGFDISKNSIGEATVADGMISGNAFEYGEAGNTYQLFFVLKAGEKVYFSQSLEKVGAENAGTVVQFGNQNNGTTTFSALAPTGAGYQGAGYWSQVSGGDVPEPTTCSLILVGLAGMGLKRLRKRGKKSA